VRRIILCAALALGAAVTSYAETAEINGAKIYYEIHGQGEPLLLLHGFNGSGQAFKDYLESYAKLYRVILPDLRGHGRSTNPSGEFTHRQSAKDMYALLDKLGIQKFKGIGTSTGGMTLVHMATQQPERAEAIVLVGATIYFPEQAREIMRSRDPDALTAEDIERASAVHKNGEAQIRALRREFYNFKDSYDDMNFTPPYLATIQARTLIVHGDRDQFFPVEIPLEMYRSIPKSYLWIVPNGPHGPHRYHPEEFLKVTQEFLAGEWESKEP
jgi:pimeloyl-ACP methyl ester carboxylesterase